MEASGTTALLQSTFQMQRALIFFFIISNSHNTQTAMPETQPSDEAGS